MKSRSWWRVWATVTLLIPLAGCRVDNAATCSDVNWAAPAGQYRQNIALPDGGWAPLYLIRYDRSGHCCTSDARARLLQELVQGIDGRQVTDVFVLSHGWNNEFAGAVENYRAFLTGYEQLRARERVLKRDTYQPLFVGIIWPSAVLVRRADLPPPEGKPAGHNPSGSLDPATWSAFLRRDVSANARLLEAELRARGNTEAAKSLRRLVRKGQGYDARDEHALAAALLPLYLAADEGVAGAISDPAAITADDLVRSWRQMSALASERQLTAEPAPGAGGSFSADIIRGGIRAATVWMMKDRASVVGAAGVSSLLRDLLAPNATARVHLVGHSYGAKVCLAALSAGGDARPVESVLLLQPAVSAWCFAERLPDPRRAGEYLDRSGGHVEAIGPRVRQPLVSTYSSRDWPLTKIFHLFVRRLMDYGEPPPGVRTPLGQPNPYWALGGFGPQGVDQSVRRERIRLVTDGGRLPTYNFSPDGHVRVIGMDGSPESRSTAAPIPGHGDVWTKQTQCLLYNQVLEGHRKLP